MTMATLVFQGCPAPLLSKACRAIADHLFYFYRIENAHFVVLVQWVKAESESITSIQI